MPADERLKVIFKRVFVRNDADVFGSGEFFFVARVNGQPVGNATRFNAVEGQSIVLPESDWSTIIDVQNTPQVVVSFQAKDEDVISDDNLGTVQHTLRSPYSQDVFRFRHGTRFFLLDWEVQLAVGGAFGRHPPDSVFATRQHTGSVTCTTVAGTTFDARMEIHPVRPVPLPPPATVLPRRPAFPVGTPAENLNSGNTLVNANSPINFIPNPAVIPVLGPPTAAPAGPHTDAALDAANWANTRNCARIEYTYYRPGTLAFTDDDRRLEWRIVPVGGGAASFLVQGVGGVLAASPTVRGLKVMVFGTAEGEVQLEVRFQGALFATFRALVKQVRKVPCRCTILNGPNAASQPRATPADVKNHIDIANRFMRQMGLELTLDTDPARSNGATATAIPGIFRISVAAPRTRNVTNTRNATVLNHRAGVMNFVYIHSAASGALGAATDYPASGAPAVAGAAPVTAGRPVITDSGTPSSSWSRPTGVGIGADATATPVTMTLLAANQRAAPPNVFAMYVTDSNGGAMAPVGNHATPARQREYANTMSHEFGHILNLGHRVEGVPETAPGANDQRDMTAADPPASLVAGGIFWDGLLHPPHENVMQWWDPSTIAQDFDILQARAAHFSPLVTGAPALPPAAPPGPAPPRGGGNSVEYTIVSGDYLSKIAQRYGMTWQQLYNYDGGTGTPNRSRLRSGNPDLIYPGEVIMVPAQAA